MRRITVTTLILPLILALLGCGVAPPDQPNGLLLSMAILGKDESGKPLPMPAELGILVQRSGTWTYTTITDQESNVFHKAMAYEPAPGKAGIVTAGGTEAILKLWRPGFEPEELWRADFGGKWSRMRDVEVGDIYGDGVPALAVATHDQGVVAVVKPDGAGGWAVEELDREPNTIVHEVELGDLDGDGVLEIYATPSLPNKLDGSPQPGQVVRYIPAKGEGRTVVADLGDQHAKEILVDDVDGDGRDELYVSVEAVSGGQVKILRFDEDTEATAGSLITTINDQLCRFLTAGDIDGDGSKEMVVAAKKNGLWLLRPGEDPKSGWSRKPIDRDSGGFEHAAILTDLDGDGVDELYVANDEGNEVNRYVWKDGKPEKTTLYTYDDLNGFTWNIMPVPVELIPVS